MQVDLQRGAETVFIRDFPINPDGSLMSPANMKAWLEAKLEAVFSPIARRRNSISSLEKQEGNVFTIELDI